VRYVATAIELIGTVITAFGLFNAQSRVTSGIGLGTRLNRLLRRGKHPVTVSPGAANLRVNVATTAEGEIDFRLRDDLTPDEKFAELADEARSLRNAIRSAKNEITQLQLKVREASTKASEEAQNALDEARRYVETVRKQDDTAQKLDLTVAIWGVAITAIGVFVSFVA
jgi:hypothetical protein